jgi:cyclohexanone monooxygenase
MNEPKYDVAIVGAGFAGLYLLYKCREMGLSARIWEAGGGVGGTWYWNRYPGARCDIESMQYSYQFDDDLQQEWNWSERYSPQPEILRYAEHVASRYQLLDGIDFNRRVASARYSEEDAQWLLTAESGEAMSARFCVMATGCLSAPNWPVIDGYDAFDGGIYHTAQWPHEGVDFNGKRVAVIGTGSSGIQSIPLIAAQAEHLTVFQRTPNYSVPAHNHAMDPEFAGQVKAEYGRIRERAKTNANGIYGNFNTGSAMEVSEDRRLEEYERRWQHGGLTFLGAYGDFMLNKEANDTLVEFVHNKIKSIVDDPQVAAMLCPPNIIGGKRMCVDTDYYATYNRDNVRLVDIRQTPIDKINKTGLLTAGEQHDVDMIVVATGFDAMTGALNRIDIRGKSDVSLRELWADGPSSYLGLAMAGFPNLFTVTGPGSPSVLTNMLPSIEQHVEWISDCIKAMSEQGHMTIEATAEAEQDWWQHVQEAGQSGLKHTTQSWYLGANIEGKARVFMPYMGGFPNYCKKCDQVVENGYEGFRFA